VQHWNYITKTMEKKKTTKKKKKKKGARKTTTHLFAGLLLNCCPMFALNYTTCLNFLSKHNVVFPHSRQNSFSTLSYIVKFWGGIHQIVSRLLERFRYMCLLLFFCVFPELEGI
jgi:hypothetical protein